MALDRFVCFKKSSRPTKAKLQLVVEDYFRGIATEIRWDQDRWLVTMPGPSIHPLDRVEPALPLRYDGGPRYIEVWYSDGTLDVITRQADELTNVIAAGLAEVCRRYWKGTKGP